MNPPILETERLWLRPICLEDAPDIQRHFPHYEIVKYMTNTIPWPYPEDGAVSFINKLALPDMNAGKSVYWTLRLKTNPDEAIGTVSISHIGNPDNAVDNRGFWLALPYHRQGLMTEAANAVTDYWFNVLGQPQMRIGTAKDNTGSAKIKQDAGFRLIETLEETYVGGKVIAERWEITRDEWRMRRPYPPKIVDSIPTVHADTSESVAATTMKAAPKPQP